MRRLQLFGHLAKRPDEEDHHWVLVAAMSNPPAGWRRPRGRPRETWLRTVSRDVQLFNIGIHSAWHRAAERQQWHQLIATDVPIAVRHQLGGTHALAIIIDKKAELPQRWPRDARHKWVHWQFSRVPEYAHGYFCQNFNVFFSDRSYECACKIWSL